MKKVKQLLVGLIMLAMVAPLVMAQSYPWTAPSYVPIAYLAPVTVSAPTTIVFTNSGSATLGITVYGTCTAVAATLKVSNDGTNYSAAINMYPINAIAASSAVTSIAAAGAWHANIQSWRYAEVAVSALTASCSFGLAADDVGLQLY